MTVARAVQGNKVPMHAKASDLLLDGLTPRERDIVSGVVEGLNNQEIAKRCGVSDWHGTQSPNGDLRETRRSQQNAARRPCIEESGRTPAGGPAVTESAGPEIGIHALFRTGELSMRITIRPSTALMLAVMVLGSHAGAEAQTCLPPPSGIVGWWPANGTANDSVAGNNGQLAGDASFASAVLVKDSNWTASATTSRSLTRRR